MPSCKQILYVPCAGFRVVFAVGMSRRMVGLRRTEPSYVDGALGGVPVHPIKRNGSAHVPTGTYPPASCLLAELLGGRSSGLIEEFAGFQHRVHNDGKLSSDRDGGAFKPDPLAQFETPVSQCALC